MAAQIIPRGLRNNNPLNLRKSNNAWLGKIEPGTDKSFEQFVSLEYGIRAAMINVRTILKRKPRCTVGQLISIWAPPVENNTDAYVQRVCSIANLKPWIVLDFKKKNQVCLLLWAMSQVENGVITSFQRFENAYAMI